DLRQCASFPVNSRLANLHRDGRLSDVACTCGNANHIGVATVFLFLLKKISSSATFTRRETCRTTVTARSSANYRLRGAGMAKFMQLAGKVSPIDLSADAKPPALGLSKCSYGDCCASCFCRLKRVPSANINTEI